MCRPGQELGEEVCSLLVESRKQKKEVANQPSLFDQATTEFGKEVSKRTLRTGDVDDKKTKEQVMGLITYETRRMSDDRGGDDCEITFDMATLMAARAARGTSPGLRDRVSLETTSKDVASCVKYAQEVVEGVNKRSSNKDSKQEEVKSQETSVSQSVLYPGHTI